MVPEEESAVPVVALEEHLGYQFRNRALLVQALTHGSCRGASAAGASPDNERLEFLGDSIIGFFVSEALYRSSPALDEGKLSRIKSNLVNAASLRRVAEKLDLGRYLLLGPGEEKSGGRKKPAILSDALEALVAALYLDGGLEPALLFVREHLLEEVERLGPESFAAADFKTVLQEFLQARRMPAARYDLARTFGPDHRKTFLVELWLGDKCLSQGEGATKKAAEQVAARQALDLLERKKSASTGTENE